MALRTYFDFAEDDRDWFMWSYEQGVVANGMAALAQNACEKYLKHLIDVYYVPEDRAEEDARTSAMHTHNLAKLTRFIRYDMGLDLDEEAEDAMDRINGFYFTTRYPGDESIEVDHRDIENCAMAIGACRSEVLRMVREIEPCQDQDMPDDIGGR